MRYTVTSEVQIWIGSWTGIIKNLEYRRYTDGIRYHTLHTGYVFTISRGRFNHIPHIKKNPALDRRLSVIISASTTGKRAEFWSYMKWRLSLGFNYSIDENIFIKDILYTNYDTKKWSKRDQHDITWYHSYESFASYGRVNFTSWSESYHLLLIFHGRKQIKQKTSRVSIQHYSIQLCLNKIWMTGHIPHGPSCN